MGAVELFYCHSYSENILICDQKGHQDFTLECSFLYFCTIFHHVVHGREKRDFCEKIATFSRWIEPLPFCHELLWLLGEEVRAYFSCPPLFEQNILFYDISFLFLTQMTPKTALRAVETSAKSKFDVTQQGGVCCIVVKLQLENPFWFFLVHFLCKCSHGHATGFGTNF